MSERNTADRQRAQAAIEACCLALDELDAAGVERRMQETARRFSGRDIEMMIDVLKVEFEPSSST